MTPEPNLNPEPEAKPYRVVFEVVVSAAFDADEATLIATDLIQSDGFEPSLVEVMD